MQYTWSHIRICVCNNSPEPKVKVFIPMYEPFEVTKCEKCGKVIAELKELIDFWKTQEENYTCLYERGLHSCTLEQLQPF